MRRIAQFDKVDFEEFKNEIFEMDMEIPDVSTVYKDLKLPVRATAGSAGYDFFAPFDFTLKPNETIKIPTGICCRIKAGWFMAIFPRSSLGFKYRLQLDNTVGIIDSDYINAENGGHIHIKITNCTTQKKTISIKKGQGFAQGIFIEFGITLEDNIHFPRHGGFGSTDNANE